MMIDIHTHILYGVDDGAQDLPMSLHMLSMSESIGITDIIATPHVLEKHTALDWSEIVSKVAQLQTVAHDNGLHINIHPGAELEMNWEILDMIPNTAGIVPYGLAGSNYLLVELPMNMLPNYADEFWFELRLLGVTPILAHPERHIGNILDESTLRKWLKEGLLLQCNAGSLSGLYGSAVKNNIEHLLQQGHVSYIASDAHNNRRRSTNIAADLQLLATTVGAEYTQQLTRSSPANILANAHARTQAKHI